MAETKKKNKKKKVTISEEDIAMLLRRYSAKTIIALLQEVALFPDAKIDWSDLAKKSSTGIKNAREYQMIWRHLAYRETLLENVEESAEPVDDDSDLETDLEAFPAVNGEAAAEAAAYAKILLDSGLPGDSSCQTGEGPLTINIPNEQPPSADSKCAQGKNITISVFIHNKDKGNKSGKDSTDPEPGSRRKRKPWTEEEDLELIAAVQKCGERNWANIVKGDFKGDRTASQLSQRWSIIRKKLDKLNTGNTSTSQLTEAQLATRRAVSHALNMQIGGNNLMAACSAGATQPSIPSNSAAIPEKSTIPLSSNGPEKSTSCTVAEKIKSIQSSSSTLPGPENTSLASWTHQAPPHPSNNTSLKPKPASTTVAAKKGPPVQFKPVPSPNPLIQATAVAAGARIAPASTAASLLKAAQSKNAVHIRPGGSGPIFKASLSGGGKSSSTAHLGSHPNVHYIRTGLAPATYSGPSPSSIPHPSNPVKQATAVSCNLQAVEMGSSDTEMKEESPKKVPEELNKEVSAIDKQPQSDNVSKPVESVTTNRMDED